MVIGICDDDKAFALQLQQKIDKSLRQQGISQIETRVYTDSKMLMKHITECNILFLDIEMKEQNSGIRIKDQIDAYQLDMAVVFVTSHEEMMEQAFGRSVQAFIRKRDIDEKLPDVLYRIIQQMHPMMLCIVDVQNILREIDIRQIRYIEMHDKYATVHMEDTDYIIRKPMRWWRMMLPETCFFEVHRKFMVNFRYIQGSLANGIFCVDDKPIEIARARRTAFKQAYRIYMRGK